MDNLFTVSEAKLKFSEIIDRIIYKKDRIIVTQKGKKVAMVDSIYEARNKEKGREVKF